MCRFGPTIVGEWGQADTDCTPYLNNVGVLRRRGKVTTIEDGLTTCTGRRGLSMGGNHGP